MVRNKYSWKRFPSWQFVLLGEMLHTNLNSLVDGRETSWSRGWIPPLHFTLNKYNCETITTTYILFNNILISNNILILSKFEYPLCNLINNLSTLMTAFSTNICKSVSLCLNSFPTFSLGFWVHFAMFPLSPISMMFTNTIITVSKGFSKLLQKYQPW